MRALVVAALLSLALPALAQEKPATATPHSPGWGQDYMEQLKEVFHAVKINSTYGQRDATNMVFFPQELKGPDGKPILGAGGLPKLGPIPAQFQGAGALAFGPDLGLNKGNPKPVVVVTNEIFTLCHGRDELAFVLAHEFAHLEKEHPKKVIANIEKEFSAWFDKLDPEEQMQQGLAQRFQRENKAKLDAFQKPLEDEADARGLELMEKAGFARTAAPAMMLHAQDMVWAMGWSNGGNHATPVARANKLSAENHKKLEEKLQMSVPKGWKAP